MRSARDLELATKVKLLSGQDMWSLPSIPELALESIVTSDGPVGVRGRHWSRNDPSIALPSPTALAATWDTDLAREVGGLLGQESRRKGVHVLLAPTVNLHRTPLGGRHFEAYSEDPFLTGEIGAAYVQGVQEQGVATTVKHYVANDSETDRFTVDVRVSQRALRELYLSPFETIVRKGNAWGVMAAYNSVNGVSMTEHTYLLRDVLKNEWGFDGVVVSDWFAARDAVATIKGGLDIAMPGAGSPWGDELIDAVRRGEVDEVLIDEAVERIIRLAERVSAGGHAKEIDGRTLARRVASRSFTLVSNRGDILPLAADSSIALIGALAKHARVLGGGSAKVYPEHVVSPLEGLRDRANVTFALGADPRMKLPPAEGPQWTGLRATFRNEDGDTIYTTELPSGHGRWMEMPDGIEMPAEVEIEGTLTADEAGTHQLSVRGIGWYSLTVDGETLFEDAIAPESDDIGAIFLGPPERRVQLPLEKGQSVDVKLRQPVSMPMISFTLGHGEPTLGEDELIEEAVRAAAEAEVAVVVVGTTEEVESEGFDRTTLKLPGRQDELVRRVAEVNPRTVVVVNAGSPVELPWADDVAAVLLTWFPGQEAGLALADVLLGDVEPGGRLPTTWPVREADCPVLNTTPIDGTLSYDDGIFVGYRAWQRSETKPRYCFGHGSGYTTWEYESLDVTDDEAVVSVRNTGVRSGREVIQVYIGPVEDDPDRPVRWLAGFATADAAPGEAVTVTIPLAQRAFQIWDGGWRTIHGDYRIEAAHSIEDVRLSLTRQIAAP